MPTDRTSLQELEPAVGVLARNETEVALYRRIVATNAVKFLHALPAFHDQNTAVGREIMQHTATSDGLEVTDEVFAPPEHGVRTSREPPPHDQGDPRRHDRVVTKRGITQNA